MGWPAFCRQHFEMHFLNLNFVILIEISLQFVPVDRISNKLSFVLAIALCRQVTNDYRDISSVLSPYDITDSQIINSSTYIYKCRETVKIEMNDSVYSASYSYCNDSLLRIVYLKQLSHRDTARQYYNSRFVHSVVYLSQWTCWSRIKMADILQAMLSNEFHPMSAVCLIPTSLTVFLQPNWHDISMVLVIIEETGWHYLNHPPSPTTTQHHSHPQHPTPPAPPSTSVGEMGQLWFR